MKIDEFTDTYSDDIIYLREARSSLLTHPLRAEIPELCNASLCRLYSIVMIGSIEGMLERWRARDKSKILDAYFAPKASNTDRVKKLNEAFVSEGINVNSDVFDDYLAIKYLRNAIVHASWHTSSGQTKQDQIDWIVARGFPTDTRNLKEEHWQKLEWVNENMMLYIGVTGLSDIQPNPNLYDFGIEKRDLPDTSGILEQTDFPRLYWGNLERISTVIEKSIHAAAIHPEFSWTEGLTNEELQALSRDALKYKFYQAAHIAAHNGFKPLTDLAGYADNAARCWKEYVRLIPEFKDLASEKVNEALATFRAIHEYGIRPKDGFIPSWAPNTPLKIIQELSGLLFKNTEFLTTERIGEALYLGAKSKRAIGNIVPLSLFSIQLPIISPLRTSEWSDVSSCVADIFELGSAWYDLQGGYEFKNENVQFYRKMSINLGLSDL
ncbi:hypothetical protein [Pseudomonas shahriarae]|uniref:Apea-like HEPN domain-containing protein n=1 Tax=Pseudomonas shahriarae TaxID=2745512 RepID=A0ABT5N8H6_9PSED|nr:hypothetical protein [Pseudomonas shahriarae]MDD0984040.1 hypothetical protein [Pseudomonas shahriarae]MDD1036230.1 hypothetical protein [Pseudomonas shahriarae]